MSTLTRTALCLLLAIPLCALTAASCSGTVTGGGPSGQSSGTAGAGAGGGGAGSTGGMGGAAGAGASGGAGGMGGSGAMGGSGGASAPAQCQNQFYACGNGLDDDGDGLVDAQDPHCLGACDNNEASFYHGTVGTGPACSVDCYFDADSGSGNDECYWNHQCDPLEVSPNYYPQWWYGTQCAYDENTATPGTNLGCDELRNGQSPVCLSVCSGLTPNGCDCFGCCELPAGSGKFVYLGSEDGSGNGSCSLEVLGDPKKCAPCTPVKGGCYNECGPCELCIGKTELPPGCATDGGNAEQCAAGIQPCGLSGQQACPAGTYCITGCCQPTLK